MKGKKRPTQWKIDGDWVGLLAGARWISGVKYVEKEFSCEDNSFWNIYINILLGISIEVK